MLNRKRKLILNSITSLAHQIITLICGFILPRVILSNYGSAVNGLVSSITQFLGFISLAECGVGAVVQSCLYKPLAEGNDEEMSKIFISSERFFKKVAYILVAYTAFLMVAYPFVTVDSFDYLYTLILIFVISISTFAQYYFGMTHRLLLNADQLGFIQLTIHSVVLILNTVSCVLLMQNGASIHVVKLTTSLIFITQPILLSFISRRKYKIDKSIVLTEEPIKQKWNGLFQHISAVVLVNVDTVILTIFSTLENISIYAVYHLVVNGVKQIVVSLTNGMQAMLGNMLVKNEIETLKRTFDTFEWLMHTAVTIVFSATALLILPFVSVYTKDINDVNYIVPAFGYLITIAQASYCLRVPYTSIILAAGHYKQTQNSTIIEVIINIVISIVLVFKFGLIGVAIGTLAAMLYRTCYCVWYLSRNIINRNLKYFFKHILVDAISVIFTVFVFNFIPDFFIMKEITYVSWFVLAIKVTVMIIVVSLVINLLFYGKFLFNLLKKDKKSQMIL